MLTKENIDLQNKEGIEFLRSSLTEIMEKMRDASSIMIDEAKQRLNRLNNEYDKLDPKNIEKSRTILTNILFFIGSVFRPEITPSEWFGKQKMGESRRNKIEKIRETSLGFVEIESKIVRGFTEMIVIINKAIMDIRKDDEALARLIDTISSKRSNNMEPLYQWGEFFKAFVSCEYCSEETFKKFWAYVNSAKYLPMQDFTSMCNQYISQYGLGTMQKGR